jgi:hypothetical protein
VGLDVQRDIVVEWISEWDKGTPVHRRVQAQLSESHKGNLYFELGDDPYVVTDLRNGAPVLGVKNGRWSPAGRVLRKGEKVFLGKWDEPSLDELLDMGRAPPSYPLEPISAYLA